MACQKPVPIATGCRHRNRSVVAVPCGSCEGCLERRRWEIYGLISEGSRRLIRNKKTLYFGTFTVRDRPGRHESRDQLMDRLLDAWDNFNRHYMARDHPGAATFRVLEIGTHRGRPHIHFVTTASMPAAGAIGPAERLGDWLVALPEASREFSDRLAGYGFGPIYHFEPAHTAEGVSKYLAGYISKQKAITRTDGRRIRTYAASQNWPRDAADRRLFRIGRVGKPDPGEGLCECVGCGQELARARTLKQHTGSGQEYSQIRQANICEWLQPLPLVDPDIQQDVREWFEGRRTYNVLRQKTDPAHRHHIREEAWGFAGYNEPTWWSRDQLIQDCRTALGTSTAALRRLRDRGYEGSLQLLAHVFKSNFNILTIMQDGYGP